MTNMKNSNFYKKTAQALGTPVFIYWEKRLETNISRIKQAAEHHLANRELGIYIPYFTNSNPYLFSIVRKHGCGIAIQSTEEWHQLNAHNLADKLIASPTVLPQEELKFLLEKGVRVNLSSIDEVEWQINNFPEKNIFIRLDISVDSSQRTGIKPWEITGLRKILKKNNKALAGVHIYVGTLSTFEKIVKYTDIVLALVSREFPEIEMVTGDWLEFLEQSGRRFDVIVCSHGPIQWHDALPRFCDHYIHIGYRTPSWAVALKGAHKIDGRQLSFSTTVWGPSEMGIDRGYFRYFARRNWLKEARHCITSGYTLPL